MRSTAFQHTVIYLIHRVQYVERSLSQAWQQLQKTRLLRLDASKASDRAVISTLRHAHSLCHRMTFFVQQYLRFMTVEVLEPQWHVMLVGIGAAASLDEVIRLHGECLRRVLQGCLLARMKTLAEIAAISLAARTFCDHMQDGFLQTPRQSMPGERQPMGTPRTVSFPLVTHLNHPET